MDTCLSAWPALCRRPLSAFLAADTEVTPLFRLLPAVGLALLRFPVTTGLLTPRTARPAVCNIIAVIVVK